MAPLPKRKLSRARGRTRLEGQTRVASIKATLATCSNCKKTIVAHRICQYCGFYKGKKVGFSKA